MGSVACRSAGPARSGVPAPDVRLLLSDMILSPKLEREVDQEIEAFEKAKRMKYINNMERRGLEKGLGKGRQERRARGPKRGPDWQPAGIGAGGAGAPFRKNSL